MTIFIEATSPAAAVIHLGFTCGYSTTSLIIKHSKYKYCKHIEYEPFRGLTPSAAFTTDLGSDAVSS